MRNALRHQLASNSPLRLSHVVAGAGGLARGRDRGPELEAELARAYGVAGARLCGSGTEALVLALQVAEATAGAPLTVAWPAFSCYDLVSAAVRFGGPVRFYDVDPETLGPDPDSLRRALSSDCGAVVVAGLFGVPVDWDVVDPIVARAGVVCIEDAAQGHGARWNGDRLGGHGRLGVLSFGRGKGWTGGSGGALLARDEGDLDVLGQPPLRPRTMADEVANLVRAAAHWALGRPGVYGLPRAVPGLALGVTTFHPVGPPTEMSRSATGIAWASMTTAEEEAEARRAVAREYALALEGRSGVRLVRPPLRGEPGWVRYPLLLPEGLASLGDTEAAVRLGAAASYPRPLPELEVLRGLPGARGPGDWPGARALAAGLVTLPTHGFTRPGERRALVRLVAP